MMLLVGSNHGLFSLVAGASGAHTIAFEPQTHLRSKENHFHNEHIDSVTQIYSNYRCH